ncbi:hypothetical protein CEUSTIGMA_g2668.t1 [Chlamydomonas eustigma]|uniref:AAA+ ATPase domain-containing protein n=1 Tax=Chlamydomonas eustigma TaxID=1157962 RepID=A0A250WWL8_9CHLO|nr:hypothetical protein CEUSTIGMA_g2668.t1 [Chlamydomonas eustigma]|eukprot:GAX75224.1 hypothetical protein CEUSTIGMA_g2668.t1 [Chlamydomonas eustigma]
MSCLKEDHAKKSHANPFKPTERQSAVLVDGNALKTNSKSKRLGPHVERSHGKRHCGGREFIKADVNSVFSGAPVYIPRNGALLESSDKENSVPAVARLEKSVLGGLTWCSSCKQGGDESRSSTQAQSVESIPLTFKSAQHYVSVFEPLLHEEARAGIQAAWQEGRDHGRSWSVNVNTFISEEHASDGMAGSARGWYSLVLEPEMVIGAGKSSHGTIGHPQALREGSLVVLDKEVDAEEVARWHADTAFMHAKKQHTLGALLLRREGGTAGGSEMMDVGQFSSGEEGSSDHDEDPNMTAADSRMKVAKEAVPAAPSTDDAAAGDTGFMAEGVAEEASEEGELPQHLQAVGNKEEMISQHQPLRSASGALSLQPGNATSSQPAALAAVAAEGKRALQFLSAENRGTNMSKALNTVVGFRGLDATTISDPATSAAPPSAVETMTWRSSRQGRVWIRVSAIVRKAARNSPLTPVQVQIHPACHLHSLLGSNHIGDSTDCNVDPSSNCGSSLDGRLGQLLCGTHSGCSSLLAVQGTECLLPVLALSFSPGGWTLTPVGPLITSQRECETLEKICSGTSVMPMRQAQAAAVDSSSSSCLSEELFEALLHPDLAALPAKGQLARLWPSDMGRPEYGPFFKYLRSSYDMTQLEAIETCASHLAHPTQRTANASPPVLPFTLIQGPPGTGKTHTVLGILNSWHLIQYRRHQDAWRLEAASSLQRAAVRYCERKLGATLRQQQQQGRQGAASKSDFLGSLLTEAAVKASSVSSVMGNTLLELLDLKAPSSAPKPRILVCAPSNAATDELLERVLRDGFKDFGGWGYRPPVVRIGGDSAPLSVDVKKVWTDALVDSYISMSQEQYRQSYLTAESAIVCTEQAMNEILSSVMEVASKEAEAAAAVASSGSTNKGTVAASSGSKRAANTSSAPFPLLTTRCVELSAKLVSLYDQYVRAQLEKGRLEEIAARFIPNSYYNERAVSENLEVSFVENAEIVFSTLSATGRRTLQRLEKGFDMVLIDEACQCNEIASLQPLVYGAAKVVLVGDPQQLPATLLSSKAKEMQMERSLFQRLQQAGFPVKLLTVQYRMHPEIRSFPSSFFYEGRLQDGRSVLETPPAAFYDAEVGLLKPYVVFDVERGREMSHSRSKRNLAEAEMAAALFLELKCEVEVQERKAVEAGKPKPPPVQVGIISPYRAQKELIRDLFSRVFGSESSPPVRIETVDSFQGKQLDVIILSCVRTSAGVSETLSSTDKQAHGGASIGFVADVRRLNVAITRAKSALWVLGHCKALATNPTWSALIADAKDRGCMIEDAVAGELFPRFSEVQAEAAAPLPHNNRLPRPSDDVRSSQQLHSRLTDVMSIDAFHSSGAHGSDITSGSRSIATHLPSSNPPPPPPPPPPLKYTAEKVVALRESTPLPSTSKPVTREFSSSSRQTDPRRQQQQQGAQLGTTVNTASGAAPSHRPNTPEPSSALNGTSTNSTSQIVDQTTALSSQALSLTPTHQQNSASSVASLEGIATTTTAGLLSSHVPPKQSTSTDVVVLPSVAQLGALTVSDQRSAIQQSTCTSTCLQQQPGSSFDAAISGAGMQEELLKELLLIASSQQQQQDNQLLQALTELQHLHNLSLPSILSALLPVSPAEMQQQQRQVQPPTLEGSTVAVVPPQLPQSEAELQQVAFIYKQLQMLQELEQQQQQQGESPYLLPAPVQGVVPALTQGISHEPVVQKDIITRQGPFPAGPSSQWVQTTLTRGNPSQQAWGSGVGQGPVGSHFPPNTRSTTAAGHPPPPTKGAQQDPVGSYFPPNTRSTAAAGQPPPPPKGTSSGHDRGKRSHVLPDLPPHLAQPSDNSHHFPHSARAVKVPPPLATFPVPPTLPPPSLPPHMLHTSNRDGGGPSRPPPVSRPPLR